MAKKSQPSGTAEVVGWAVCALLFLSSLAALRGAYVAHFGVGGLTFGSSNASLALIAFAINIALWTKCLYWLLQSDK